MLRKNTVAIFGLGYVGTNLLCLASKKGFFVKGYDINPKTTELLKKSKTNLGEKALENCLKKHKKRIFISPTPKEAMANASIVVICAPTPIGIDHKPDLRALKNITNLVSKNLEKGQLIILESTAYPGVSEEIVIPILEKTGLRIEKDFFFAYCPERVDPGSKKWKPEKIDRVLGARSKKSIEKAKKFYSKILSSKIFILSIKEAEAVKVFENCFRDVNIAFVNELAMSFAKLGIDITKVIKGASTKPFGFMPFYPGPGVGGHCIPVDPYYLIEKAKTAGFRHSFLGLARKINDGMAGFVVNLVLECLSDLGKPPKKAKVVVLGLSYKKNVKDTRESPSYRVLKILRKHKIKPLVFDPLNLEESNLPSLDKALKKTDCVVLVTDHSQFTRLSPDTLKKLGVRSVVDARNVWNKKKIISLGIIYRGIGR